ncbi:MAG: hypothetical protein JWN34_5452 [Bryobacterales bacterium]|nr:hypothetical protein [Bryobacterales bacterium]
MGQQTVPLGRDRVLGFVLQFAGNQFVVQGLRK